MINVHELINTCEDRNAGNDDHGDEAWAALRAVVDLHAPNPGMPLADTWCMHCLDDNLGPKWPCPTVRKITAALEAK